MFDFGLTADREQRAARLHAECVVFDLMFQGPCDERSFDDDLDAETRADWDEHHNPGRSLSVPTRLLIRREAAGADTLQRAWKASGVTAGNRQMPPSIAPRAAEWWALAAFEHDAFEWLVKARRADDVRRAKREGRHAQQLNFQSLAGDGRDVEVLTVAHDFGVRMAGLTYNLPTKIGTGCTEAVDDGLTAFGRSVVAAMNDLGIIVDTSHAGRRTTLDACDVSRAPVIASHTSAAGLYEVDRAKSDDECRALAATGGVVGVYAVPYFLAAGETVTIEAMLDHVVYLVDLLGIDHVGIGTDWPMQLSPHVLEVGLPAFLTDMGFREEHGSDPMARLVGFRGYDEWPNITRGLVARGFDDTEVAKVVGLNALRVFEAVCG